MNENKFILVTGATGRQGGATARALKMAGHRVRGLTRDSGKPAAKALCAEGIDVVEGDLNDPSSVRPHLADVDRLFAVQNFWEAGYDGEVRQGCSLIDLAKEAGVRHFVYSSVISADRNTGIPHWESKWEIEQHLRSSQLAYTVLRPSAFMDDWENERKEIAGGFIELPLDPMTPYQLVAVSDIAAFAVIAFEKPDGWFGRTVEIAGDDSPMLHIAAVFSRVTGRKVRYTQMPWKLCRSKFGDELTAMFRYLNDVGTSANIPALRLTYPELTTVEQYLRRHRHVWTGRVSQAI